jgi:hypothetical protein
VATQERSDEGRYARVRQKICPRCPLYATCPQFPEQLDACADAALLSHEIAELFPEKDDA